MLELIRSKAQGWFAWLIVIMITVPFALWGIHQYFGGSSEAHVASVNGQEISQARLQQAYDSQRERLQKMFGKNFNPELFPEQQMKAQILDGMIRQEVLLQAAQDSGLRIGDQMLASMIREVPAFQKDGKFSQSVYEQAVLTTQHMSVGEFETQARRQLVSQQFQGAVMGSEFVTASESEAIARLRAQTRDVGYFAVAAKSYENEIKVSDDEVSKFYEANAARFTVPERASVNYIDLDANSLAKDIAVSDDEIKQRYDSQEINYRIPEERKARHILISVAPDADAKTVAEAKAKIEALLARVKKGESFAELAKTDSQDPGSAKDGGELGFFGKGVMDPVFEKAVFSLKKGEVSEPVRSRFGFHIIQLEDVRGGNVKPLAEVRPQIIEEIRQEQAEQRYYDLAGKLGNLAYEHPDSLDEASKQLGLPIQHSEPFGRSGGGGIAANPKVVAAAFSDAVLNGGNNSEAIEIGDKHVVVLHLNEHFPEKRQTLDEVKSRIVADIKTDKAKSRAEEVATSLAARLTKGENPNLLAKEVGATWNRVDKVASDNKELPAAVVTQAFRMPHPAASSVSVATVAMPGGNQAVVALYAVTTSTTVDENERKSIEHQLQQAYAEAEFNSMMASLEAQAKIKR